MSYEFGTNWSDFARRSGLILGPLLGYETLTAFFMEAGFLGIMLFGLKRVGKKLHFAATCFRLSSGWVTRKPLMREQEGLSPCQR
jgi:cytochrome d ubiquinol oxidase subunit I